MKAEMWFLSDEKESACRVVTDGNTCAAYPADGRELVFDCGTNGLEKWLVKEGYITLLEIRPIFA